MPVQTSEHSCSEQEEKRKKKIMATAPFVLLLIVALLLFGLVVAALVLITQLHKDYSWTPQIQSFTALGAAWCLTRYRAAFADGHWSAPSAWTPTPPAITTNAQFNSHPSVAIHNASHQQVVRWQRQVRGDPEWYPVALARAAHLQGVQFVDVQHPCVVDVGPVPAFSTFVLNRGMWCPTSYSVANQLGGRWSAWSPFVSSPTQSGPLFLVAGTGPFVFRRRLNEKDTVGAIVAMRKVADQEYVDEATPCAYIQVSTSTQHFYLALNEGSAGEKEVKIRVPLGRYDIQDLLSILAAKLSAVPAIGSFLAQVIGGNVTMQANIPTFGHSVDEPLTYRVRTLAGPGLRPQGTEPSLNALLGFAPEPDAHACPSGPLCWQTAPTSPQFTLIP